MTAQEIELINKYMAQPCRLSFTADEALRVKNNLNCRLCTGSKHTKETRCGKCKIIAEHLKKTKVLSPVLF